jgi:hypothetical protein
MALYDELINVCIKSRTQSLELIDRFLQRGNYQLVCQNLWSASAWMMQAAMTEWRLGSADPSPYLREAISDTLRLTEFYERAMERIRLPFLGAFWNAMYAELLLHEPVNPQFRRLARVPPRERREPTELKDAWSFPWDSLVFELIETGKCPEEWPDFVRWLDDRHGAGTLRATMLAYAALLEAARADDRAAAAKAIREAERRFVSRRNLPMTWGNGLADRTVDFRLACLINAAERLRPGITSDIHTVHRWPVRT